MFYRLAALSLLFAVPATAQPSAPEMQTAQLTILETQTQAVVDAISGEKSPDDIFAEVFLTAVPPAQFSLLSSQLQSQHGPILGVESVTPTSETSANIVLRFEKALANAFINIEADEPYKVDGLRLISFDTLDDSVAKVEEEINALPGDVSVLLTRLGSGQEPVLAIDDNRQYAIGSTFKLYILSALARSVENGERDWSDVITIDRKSFPSGQMQNWPDGAPVTLHTLATMMISISDNTATDLLLHELGRDTVEAELRQIGHSEPNKTLPFLSTLEMFALKGSPDNMQKYIAGDMKTKRAILADFADDIGGNPALITPPRFSKPTEIDTLEWFASARDLQKLAARLSSIESPEARQIMGINTVLPKSVADEWLYVGYKGGSEPGVLNLTWLLQDEAERWYILTLSWNNTEENVDLKTLLSLAQRLLPFAYE